MPGRANAAGRSGVAVPREAVPRPWLLGSAGPVMARCGIGGPAAGLTGRSGERGVLDRFVAGVRAGEGRALVVRGEPGVGKTVLLDYLAGRASGCLVARAAGVQSEMELAFAGLHQLCAPMLDHAESLPGPQREALRTAFGLSAGPAPDRFLVGLAVLGLLSETAGERPLVCVVDDQQWLDRASAQALGFAARRLAADPVGLVFAARVPGKDEAGLAEFGARVRFRHPLVRSAAYRSASVQTRQELHGALAEVTDPAADPDRRAWHRAQAAPGPDEEVAAELEQSAGRAQRRGGLAAAAAFLERSAGLTLDPARRAQRALAAAQARHQAGALDAALGLLAMAQAGPLDELQRARGDLLRAQIAFASSHGRDAPPLMLSAAKQLEALDVGLARETYLEAFTAALFVGRLSPAVGDVARAARMAPAPLAPARPRSAPGRPGAAGHGGLCGRDARPETGAARLPQSGHLGGGGAELAVARRTGGHGGVGRRDMAHPGQPSRQARVMRGHSVSSPSRSGPASFLHAHAGELEQGAALIAEAQAVADATGSQLGPYGALGVAAWRGREAEATELIRATMDGVTSRGEGRGVTSQYTAALLYNGLGHYDKALAAAELACQYDDIGVLG